MQASTDLELPERADAGDARVAGLTILYHPALSRVGERALLTGLERGARFELSRFAPEFAAPGSREERRPLIDVRVSRTPAVLRGERGGVTLEYGEGGAPRSPVVADGHAVEQRAHFDAAALARGVVLTLGGRVVLLLHLLDPASDAGEPAFGIVGASAGIVRVRRELRKVATFDVPVLIAGESGTGKELVARALHDASARRAQPYVTVNLGAVPPALAAAELFGAVRGAFTGATQDRAGLFQRAHGGTLFLDEIGEASPELQVLLLRCLEEGAVQPVGADRARAVDVRVVAATDADLEAAIAAARFRAPLLYRLSGYVLRLPPLRERRDDLGRLLVAFLRRELAAIGEAAVLDDGREPWLPAEAVARLAGYDWPGNVRQLGNVVRQLVIANRGAGRATQLQVLDELAPRREAAASARQGPVADGSHDDVPGASAASAPRPSDISEEQLVAALRAHRYSPERAAAALGIPRPSIYRLMDRSSRVRKASELTAEEIEAAAAATAGDEEAMAERLEVSLRALRRRRGELGRP
jgi:two-component system nitrogen regulation response regulator GlnG